MMHASFPARAPIDFQYCLWITGKVPCDTLMDIRPPTIFTPPTNFVYEMVWKINCRNLQVTIFEYSVSGNIIHRMKHYKRQRFVWNNSIECIFTATTIMTRRSGGIRYQKKRLTAASQLIKGSVSNEMCKIENMPRSGSNEKFKKQNMKRWVFWIRQSLPKRCGSNEM